MPQLNRQVEKALKGRRRLQHKSPVWCAAHEKKHPLHLRTPDNYRASSPANLIEGTSCSLLRHDFFCDWRLHAFLASVA